METITKRGPDWPLDLNGTPKRVKDMTKEERQELAKQSVADVMGEMPETYLEEFERAFDSIFK